MLLYNMREVIFDGSTSAISACDKGRQLRQAMAVLPKMREDGMNANVTSSQCWTGG